MLYKTLFLSNLNKSLFIWRENNIFFWSIGFPLHIFEIWVFFSVLLFLRDWWLINGLVDQIDEIVTANFYRNLQKLSLRSSKMLFKNKGKMVDEMLIKTWKNQITQTFGQNILEYSTMFHQNSIFRRPTNSIFSFRCFFFCFHWCFLCKGKVFYF